MWWYTVQPGRPWIAEDDDKVEKVRKVNVTGTENITLACKELDCKMVYISTDYVFDGMGTEPWQRTIRLINR